jgi:hypothetical protein
VEGAPGIEINEPADGEPAKEMKPADWHGVKNTGDDSDKELGLRAEKPASAVISRASSVRSQINGKSTVPDEIEGVRPYGPQGEEEPGKSQTALANESATKNVPVTSSPLGAGAPLQGIPQIDGQGSNIGHVSTADLPGGVRAEELKDHDGVALGGLKIHSNKQFE